MPRTIRYFLAVAATAVDHQIVFWDFVIRGAGGNRLEFRITQVEDTMAFEAVHELMRHHAIRTKEIRTVEATSYSVGFSGFAPGTTNSTGAS